MSSRRKRSSDDLVCSFFCRHDNLAAQRRGIRYQVPLISNLHRGCTWIFFLGRPTTPPIKASLTDHTQRLVITIPDMAPTATSAPAVTYSTAGTVSSPLDLDNVKGEHQSVNVDANGGSRRRVVSPKVKATLTSLTTNNVSTYVIDLQACHRESRSLPERNGLTD